MPTSRALRRIPWAPIAESQSGMISRSQLLQVGLTAAQAKADVTNGRWQRVHPGVYATFTGSVDPLGQVWGGGSVRRARCCCQS